MLPGLSPLEIGRLRMSVGYGTHKAGRPLSPAEVGSLLQRALNSGATLEDCAKTLNFKGTSQLSRFIRVLGLSSEILHLVDWGRSDDSAIGFTTAVEVARVVDINDKHAIARAILEHGLRTDEVRQVAQIRRRSQRSIEDCLKEVIDMRPVIDRRYVFIGAVVDEEVRAVIAEMTQAERNALFHSAIDDVGLGAVSGRLGEQFFTIVGDEQLNSKLTSQGREAVEARLRTAIKKRVVDA